MGKDSKTGRRSTEMKTISDFTVDSVRNSGLVSEFQRIAAEKNGDALNQWFKDKGYDVSIEDCQSILSDRSRSVFRGSRETVLSY